MWAGYDDNLDPDGKIVRSLIKFDMSDIPAGTTIDKATAVLRHAASWDFPDTSQTITAYAVDSDWSACSTTWDSQPGIGATYGSQSVMYDIGDWYEFDVTDLVQDWADDSTQNYGMWLRGPEYSGPDSSWRSFFSVDSSDAPYLSITYAGRTAAGMTANAGQVNTNRRSVSSEMSVLEQLSRAEASDSIQQEDGSEQRRPTTTAE